MPPIKLISESQLNNNKCLTIPRQQLAYYARKANVKVSFKMFRSTFASNLVMSGVDIYTVSKLLGHHDVIITEKHYAPLKPQYLYDSIRRLKPQAPPDVEVA